MGEKIYIHTRLMLTHQGSKLYKGDFGEAIRTNLAKAIHAEAGVLMKIKGLNNI